jgi:serine/threonine protein kinase/Flp pilus assembly protein TadD
MQVTRQTESRSATEARVCRKCGRKILADAPQGICSPCLLKTGLGPFVCNDKEESHIGSILREFGDYHLVEEIGRGGQGVVYRARQKSLNRTVALKVIGLGHFASTPHLRRFRQEAEAAASLEHPQIVPIYEIGERDGSCYFSMKFIEGGQLDGVLKHEALSARKAAELLVKIARTVQFAHEHGILHRDIKPGNILIDKNGEPHLTDFGLARLIENESTVTNSFDVLGTPGYMSPEQAAGNAKELTPVADVYALGAVFYQMLTGEPPFAGGTTYETIRLVIESEPRSPRSRNPKVDVDLATICLKCLEKEPGKRYPSAAALTEDLERWLRYEPIHARRSGPVRHSLKFVRRHPIASTIVPLLLALATAIIVLIWNNQQSEKMARELRAKIPDAERSAVTRPPTQNVEAYGFYLRARALLHGTNTREADSLKKASQAVTLLEKAVALDPDFALAYCELTGAHLLRHFRGEPVQDALAKAEEALHRAQQLAPNAGETYLAEGLYYYWGHRDYDHALESFEKAAQSSPNNPEILYWNALVERRFSRWNDSVRHNKRASELDPKEYRSRAALIGTLQMSRQLRQSFDISEKAMVDLPEKDMYWRIFKLSAALFAGDLQRAETELNGLPVNADTTFVYWVVSFYKRDYAAAFEVIATAPPAFLNIYGESYSMPFLQALTARAAGNTERARTAFLAARHSYLELLHLDADADLTTVLPASNASAAPIFPDLLSLIAIADAGLGRKQQAIGEARRAVELRPISHDAINGANIEFNLALVYLWTGERDKALDQLSRSVKRPGRPSYGELKLDAVWDEVRDDPRFQKLLSQIVPADWLK